MTVKIVPQEDKEEIGMLYLARVPSDELARTYGVSKRTINRVLVEQQVNRAQRRSKQPVPHGLPIDMFDFPELPVTDQIKPQPQQSAPQETPLPELTFFENIKVLLKVVFLRNNKRNDQATR